MTTIYKIKSSATRAAKAKFGEGWKEVATIAGNEAEGWVIMTEVVKVVDPVAITKEVEVIEQLNAIDADAKKKASKKKEIESRKPAFIPQAPSTSLVAEIPAPTPEPSLPAFLIPSPPSETPVPELPAHPDMEFTDFEAASKAADAMANLEAVNVDPLKPRMSRIDRPTKAVWNIADDMFFTAQESNQPTPKRKDVIAECVRQGIAYGTARTQYQHWFKTMADSAATPIATIGKDGKIVPPAAK